MMKTNRMIIFRRGRPSTAVSGFLFCCLVLSAGGCGLIDFTEPETVSTNPDTPDQILAEDEEITVSFPPGTDRSLAEDSIRVKSWNGYVQGDFVWREETAGFRPRRDLETGIRYELSVHGEIPVAGKRPLEPDIYIPFYRGIKPSAHTGIISVKPGFLLGPDSAVTVNFSCPMNTDAADRSVSTDPPDLFSHLWNGEGTVLELIPADTLENGTSIELVFSSEAVSMEGVPFSGKRRYLFQVEYDTVPPSVVSAAYALADWQAGFPVLGTDLNLLQRTDALRITFSEPMDPSAAEQAVVLSPAISGHRSWISDTDFVIVPEGRWETGRSYTLSIGKEAVDLGGNRLEAGVRITFTPNIPPFRVEELRLETQDAGPVTRFSTADPVLITPAPYAGDYTFQFVFTEPAAGSDAQNAVQSTFSVQALYPITLPMPRITGISWPDMRTLTVSCSGFLLSRPDRTCWYKIRIGGGGYGTLPEPMEQLIRTVQE